MRKRNSPRKFSILRQWSSPPRRPSGKELQEIERILNSRSPDRFHRVQSFVHHPKRNVREAALTALATFGPVARDAYRDATSDPDIGIRYHAVSTLGRFGHSEDLPLLLGFLQSESEDIREGAVRSLAFFPDERAHAAIVEAEREDPSEIVRNTALSFLARRGTEQDVPLLMDRLKTELPEWLRATVAGGLYQLGRREYLMPFLEHLQGSIPAFEVVIDCLERGFHPDDVPETKRAIQTALRTRLDRHSEMYHTQWVLDRARSVLGHLNSFQPDTPI